MLEQYGVSAGDRRLHLWGNSGIYAPGKLSRILVPVKRLIKEVLLNYKIYSAYDREDKNYRDIYNYILDKKPKIISGYATSIYYLAKYIEKYEQYKNISNLRVVVITAEKLYETQINEIEKIFQCTVVNEYGCSEVGVIGYECRMKKLHINETMLDVEIEKKESEKEGKIIITQYRNEIAPLIRYDTGDIGKEIVREYSCDCGMSGSILVGFSGRKNDWIVDIHDQKIHSEKFTHKLKYITGLNRYQIVQKKDKSIWVYISLENDFKVNQVDELLIRVKKCIAELVQFNGNIYVENVGPDYFKMQNKHRWIVCEIHE